MRSEGEAGTRPLILFLHVDKTGGSTLRTIIRRQYLPGAVCTLRPPPFTPAALRGHSMTIPLRAAAVLGHMPFGLHELLGRQSTYITLLRNPIARVISNYYSLLSRPDNPLHERLRSRGMTLQQYASGDHIPGVDNRQTRFLSGRGELPERCTVDMLEAAKRNLREHFSVVGLTEKFDETLILLRRHFRWRRVLYWRRNVTPDRADRRSVTRDTLRAIEGSNELDMELYNYARVIFEEQLGRQKLDFEMELEAFRRVNEEYGRPSRRRDHVAHNTAVETVLAAHSPWPILP